MPCYHPLTAWRARNGTVNLGREPPDATPIPLPCGGCIGCRTQRAKEWALRCQLEYQQHSTAIFTTLTYDDTHLPPTLQKRHLQLWLKRLRRQSDRPIRFFACGEYGERTARPHYHAILYGLGPSATRLVDATWAQGYTTTEPVTPARIAYTAGYCNKKLGWELNLREERIDYETGECYMWQPPFIQMSRGGRHGHGIGGHARQWPNSWRKYAIYQGHKMKVPRYLHDSWRLTATTEELEQLQYERDQDALNRHANTKETLKAGELIAYAKHKLRSERRAF